MRKLRYAVAMSLDGHIAGPNGEYDWIGTDPQVDFAAFWSQFDTLLIGRRTFELAVQTRGEAAFTPFTGVTSIVFSRTLKQQEHPYVTVVPELNANWVRDLKAQSGKDI
jgi:dihydrofolate reductase